MLADQSCVIVGVIDVAVVRKFLINRIIDLIGYLAGFVFCFADYDRGEIRDVDSGCNDDHKSYEEGYECDLSGAHAESEPGRASRPVDIFARHVLDLLYAFLRSYGSRHTNLAKR